MKRRFRRISVATGLMAVLMAIAASSAFAATQVKTLDATEVGPHSAVLRGAVFLEYQSALVGFEYGETTAYGSEGESPAIPVKVGWVYPQSRIEGLEPGTTYHYRFGAIVDEKLVYAQDKTFTTAQPSFNAERYPAELRGGQSIDDPLVLGMESGPLTCESAVNGKLSSQAGSITVTPSFSGCALTENSATVSVNGCSYVFHAGSGTSGTMDIVCPAGKAITVTALTCAMSIPPQTGLSSVDAGISNESLDGTRLALRLNVSGLKYTKTADGFGCKFNGTGTKEDGTYGGRIDIQGEFDGGSGAKEAIDLGFLVTTMFKADQYPATLSGQQAAGAPLSLGFESGSLTCSSATASGTLSTESDTLTLAPTFSGCGLAQQNAAISMNGCGYVFHAGSGTPSTMDIACPAGKAITGTAMTCAFSIPAQTGLAVVNPSNDTSSSPKKLKLGLAVSGLRYTKTADGFGCKFNGTGTREDGTYGGTLSVSATDAASKAIGVGVSS